MRLLLTASILMGCGDGNGEKASETAESGVPEAPQDTGEQTEEDTAPPSTEPPDTGGVDTGSPDTGSEPAPEVELDPEGGDGSIDIDTLYVVWDGVFLDGNHSTGTRELPESSGIEEIDPLFQFIFVDTVDYDATSSDYYLCRTIYNLQATSVPTVFISSTWDGYDGMSWDIVPRSSGPGAAVYEGNCEDAASSFDVSSMEDWIDLNQWGYGFGAMVPDLAEALDEGIGSEYDELGDTAGTAYIKWLSGGDDYVTEWGYFQVYGYGDGSMIDFEAGPLPGVRDRTTPSDGYYDNTSFYTLSLAE